VSSEDSAPLMVAPFRLDSLHGSAAPPPAPREHGRHAVHAHRKRRSKRRIALFVALLLVIAAAGAFAGVRLRAADPPPVVSSVMHTVVPVPAQPVTLPWPATGQAAIAIPSIGVVMASGAEEPVPVASLTKLMTAYLILRDHPLILHEAGPSITVTQTDVDDYNHDTVNDDSNAQVTVGEQLTEQQLLGGLLVHSADDYADMLARWDAGSTATFVAKMNVVAAHLGMVDSHFDDASGISPASQSTAADELKVAALDMANPIFASIVRKPSITLPVAGTLSTYTPLIGLQGIIGVKSGYTAAAGGCDVLGVVRTVHGRPVLLLAAVTGQTGDMVLAQAGLHGLALVNALGPLIGSTPVLRGGQLVAHVTEAGRTVDARAAASVSVLTWPGVQATRRFRPVHHLTDQALRGARIGTVEVTVGLQHVAVPVRLQQDVPRKSLFQRLF
jgi:serine-type D-Ala-D-Ala carboxypeptidase (penicillin-binding protein 5/6)